MQKTVIAVQRKRVLAGAPGYCRCYKNASTVQNQSSRKITANFTLRLPSFLLGQPLVEPSDFFLLCRNNLFGHRFHGR